MFGLQGETSMNWILEHLTFWNLMGCLGTLVLFPLAGCAAYGMVQGLVEGWRESFPDGFRWPWQARPQPGKLPRIYHFNSSGDLGGPRDPRP